MQYSAKYFLSQIKSFFRYAENNPVVTKMRLQGARNLLKLSQDAVEKDDDANLRREIENLIAWIAENSST